MQSCLYIQPKSLYSVNSLFMSCGMLILAKTASRKKNYFTNWYHKPFPKNIFEKEISSHFTFSFIFKTRTSRNWLSNNYLFIFKYGTIEFQVALSRFMGRLLVLQDLIYLQNQQLGCSIPVLPLMVVLLQNHPRKEAWRCILAFLLVIILQVKA